MARRMSGRKWKESGWYWDENNWNEKEDRMNLKKQKTIKKKTEKRHIEKLFGEKCKIEMIDKKCGSIHETPSKKKKRFGKI